MINNIDANILYLENKLKNPNLTQKQRDLYNKLLFEQRKYKMLGMA